MPVLDVYKRQHLMLATDSYYSTPNLDALMAEFGLTRTDVYKRQTIHNLRGKPTNSEFIAMIADKMRLDKRQQAG